MAFRISRKVASDAAFLASTLPIPGMSIVTPAMLYFPQLSTYINTQQLLVFIGDKNE
jgi:hypothetical protein